MYCRVVCSPLLWLLVIGLSMYAPPLLQAKDPAPRVRVETQQSFQAFTAALEAAIQKHHMGLVCRANAQAGAASRGVTIPGNQVFMIYRPDFAIRMLEADVEAGFEAPLRLYVIEKPDGTAAVSYIKPSDVFVGYSNPKLDTMARELDMIFEAIVHEALQE